MLSFALKNKLRQTIQTLKHYWLFGLIVLAIPFLFWDYFAYALLLCATYPLCATAISCGGYIYLCLFRKTPLIVINPAQAILFRGTKQFKMAILIKVVALVLEYLLFAMALVALFRPSEQVLHAASIFFGLISCSMAAWSKYNRQYRAVCYVAFAFLQVLAALIHPTVALTFSLFSLMMWIARFPNMNWGKYCDDLRLIYRAHAALARGDIAEMQVIAQTQAVRDSYRLRYKSVLGNPLIGKSIYIDTLRASRANCLVLLLIYVLSLCVLFFPIDDLLKDILFWLFAGSFLGAVGTEYSEHARAVRSNMKKGFPIPFPLPMVPLCGCVVPCTMYIICSIPYAFAAPGFPLVCIAASLTSVAVICAGVCLATFFPHASKVSKAVITIGSFFASGFWIIQ